MSLIEWPLRIGPKTTGTGQETKKPGKKRLNAAGLGERGVQEARNNGHLSNADVEIAAILSEAAHDAANDADHQNSEPPRFPEPDMGQLRTYFGALFRHADPEGFINLRAFWHEPDQPAVFVRGVRLSEPDFLENVAQAIRDTPEGAVTCPPVACFDNPTFASSTNVKQGLTVRRASA
jgi:hypothetical protein